MPTPISGLVVRPARSDELAAAGELVADVYLRDGWSDEAYAEQLRDAAGRARTADVLVAVDGPGTLLGTVTLATRLGPLAELAAPGEAVMRMLASTPAARGRGVGSALVQACLDQARADGCRFLRLSTQARMASAHRIYARVGFEATPWMDWSPGPGFELFAYAVALVPFCDGCGEPLTVTGHERCVAARAYEPPRYCPQCRRRMVVQVLPAGWSARCVEHGTLADHGAT